MTAEARFSRNGEVRFETWFRWVVGLIVGGLSLLAMFILSQLWNKVEAQGEKIGVNAVAVGTVTGKVTSLSEDIKEIKGDIKVLLRRSNHGSRGYMGRVKSHE